jgi:asparagine synthase (glutamine-hydrolysing)
MCAIAGIISFSEPTIGLEEAVRAATSAMSHRGPGGDGFYHQDQVWLGHRYLPIVDPPHGRQPMHRQRHCTIVFNGEIYNAVELREQLQSKGFTFETRTDTEVILAAYEAWGLDCLSKLRGMFAFALSDWKTGKLHLARDPLGIKPVVYFQSKGIFAFASEIGALRKIPQVRATDSVDTLALDDYLRLLYIPCPRTIFKHIRKLPPAHILTVDIQTGETQTRRYWQLEYRPIENRSVGDWQEATEEVLRDSIRAHLVADVKVGALLSGGVDSTLVAREMNQLAEGRLMTFTTGFSDHSGRDERTYARQVAEILGTDHGETMMETGIMKILPAAARACGEPFGDSSLLCAWELCRYAKTQVGVVLTGDGGDEFFGGYPLYREWLRRSRWSAGPHPMWKRMLQPVLHRMRPQRFPSLSTGTIPGAELWADCVEYFPAAMRRRLWRPDLWRDEFAASSPAAIRESFSAHQNVRGIAKAQACDIDVYLPGDILPKMDAASMAHGLEARTPFVDVRVAEFAATIPEHILTRGDPTDAANWSGKEPLKKWMSKQMPASLVDRPKQGFTAPLRQWLMDDSSAHDRLRDALESSDSKLRNWFDPQELRAIGTSSQLHLQWQMLFLSVWSDELQND